MEKVTCKCCNGTGWTMDEYDDMYGDTLEFDTTCTYCEGTGKMLHHDTECKDCGTKEWVSWNTWDKEDICTDCGTLDMSLIDLD